MRIIVWGINYSPELTGIAPFNTGLCDYLVERGHHVEMVTTFPYYPFWQKIPGDRGKLYRTDEFDGVWVHRCWHHVPATVTNLRRIWHELSFALTSFARILVLARPDLYVVISPPLLLGPLASLVGWLKRRPYVFHVQDLQPDAAVGLGMVHAGAFTRLLYRIEAWSYRHAVVVSGISHGMLAAFTRKGVPAEKQVLFPNWIRSHGRNAAHLPTNEARGPQGTRFRRKFGLPDDVFVASYSGNLGRKQGLETLLDAALILAREREPRAPGMPATRVQAAMAVTAGAGAIGNHSGHGFAAPEKGTRAGREIVILVIGDGAMRPELEKRVAAHGLANVRMLPLLIEADYHAMLAGCDVSLILQAPGTGQYFFPSKLLSVLAMRSPVLSVADDNSELARAVNDGGFGLNVPPASPRRLAEAIHELAGDPKRLQDMSRRSEWVRQFLGEKVLGEFETVLRIIGGAGPARDRVRNP